MHEGRPTVIPMRCEEQFGILEKRQNIVWPSAHPATVHGAWARGLLNAYRAYWDAIRGPLEELLG
eukprot:2906925-Pyramimonas_sp.AAC.1